MREAVLPRLSTPALVAAGLGGNALLAVGLARGDLLPAVAAAALPAALIAAGALVASDRSILLFAALGLPLVGVPVTATLPLPGATKIYVADVVVLLAFAAWLTARLVAGRPGARPPVPRAAVLGLPFFVFAVLVVIAVVRGHEAYGTSLLAQPLRLFLYAAIVTAVVGVDSRRIYEGIVVVFYGGTVASLGIAAYHVAAGTAQTRAVDLSTGGTRVLALSVSLYLAGALFLAILNLEIDHSARRRVLHLSFAGLALFGIILAFGRGTFAAVAIVVPLLMIGFRRIRRSLVALLPLFVPVLGLAIVFIGKTMPEVGPTLINRFSGSLSDDVSVRWREIAGEAVWEQVRESPLTGVGFGRETTIRFLNTETTISQDPHNSFLFLLAGGGILLLAAFLAVCAVYVRDAWRRYREAAAPHERIIVVWSAATLFAFLLNALAEPLFTWPSVLLTVWALLVLPYAVRPKRGKPAARGAAG